MDKSIYHIIATSGENYNEVTINWHSELNNSYILIKKAIDTEYIKMYPTTNILWSTKDINNAFKLDSFAISPRYVCSLELHNLDLNEYNYKIVNEKISEIEERLTAAIRQFGSLKDDENRAREQLKEIKELLFQAKDKTKDYKLPMIPKNYFVEYAEAVDAINAMIIELEKRPISIKILNLRVDTARDLVLKVYNTINEATKTAKMAEMAIVYGNRYRITNRDVDSGISKAEGSFFKGNYKISLEQAITAINIVEPGIHKKLLEEYKD